MVPHPVPRRSLLLAAGVFLVAAFLIVALAMGVGATALAAIQGEAGKAFLPIVLNAKTTGPTPTLPVPTPTLTTTLPTWRLCFSGLERLGHALLQPRFQDLAVLPPYNTLWAQVVAAATRQKS
jgi:hypothetical protein